MDFYAYSCIAAFAICLPLAWRTRPKEADRAGASVGFAHHQTLYLWAWGLAVCADWLQGPYVYALYSAFGFSHAEIGQLFVAGFGASFLFGTFVSSFSDAFGRKRSTLLYCILYIVSCLTKHVNSYWVLMFGRVTGGIATSILFSVFESWLVCEHTLHSYPQHLLSHTFTYMWALNYIVAIISGVTAEFFVDMLPMHKVGNTLVYFGGTTIAFDMSIVVLVLAMAFIAYFWQENYGFSIAQGSGLSAIFVALRAFGEGVSIVCSDASVGMCALVVAMFESSMYIFVFNWTPVLSVDGQSPPFGIIFSTFMIACMSGAALFQLTSLRADFAVMLVLVLAAVGLSIPTIIGINAKHTHLNFLALCLFELAVGIYFPAISTIRSKIVHEPHRATIYSIFRMPMNAIVVAVLLFSPPLLPTFVLISCMMMVALCVQAVFVYKGLLKTALEKSPLVTKEPKDQAI